MKAWLFPFIGIAALALILSLAVHLSALFRPPIPLGHGTWGLDIGIFFVWILTVIVASFLKRGVDRKNWWRYAIRCCPE